MQSCYLFNWLDVFGSFVTREDSNGACEAE